jgi:hypothetical protein
MMHADRTIDEILDELDAQADPAFVGPALDAGVAEAVLGASGGARTPHRRLLERRNGGYFFERALHIFGACEEPPWHSLRAWNAPSLWRETYGDLGGGLVFFAEDAFGDQFGYSGQGGAVVVFEAELGRVVEVAPHFVAWLEAILAAPEEVLPVEMVRRKERGHRRLAPGEQLFAYPPLCTMEAHQEGVTVGHVDAVEAMRFRGDLARQLHHLPVGARVKIEIPE